MSFFDLKIISQTCKFPLSIKKETPHEFRENRLCPVDGLCHHIRVSKMRRSIQRQSQRYKLFLLGSVPLHGLRSAHLPRKFERYSGLPACHSAQAVSLGDSRVGFPQYARPCKSEPGLEDLRRFCPDSHSKSPKALRRRFLRHRTGSGSIYMPWIRPLSIFVWHSFPGQNSGSARAR